MKNSIPDLAFSMTEKIVKMKDKPEELIRAKQLIDECKLDDAEQLIRNFEEKGGHTLHEKVICLLLKCNFLHKQGRMKEVLTLAEKTYNMSLGLGKNLLSVDSLIWMVTALIILNRLDKAYNIIKQGEELLKTLPQEVPTDYKQREASLASLKGWFYAGVSNADQALKQFELSLALREELGITHEIAESLSSVAYYLCVFKGELKLALKYAERSVALAKESTKKFSIAYSLFFLAMVYGFQGELDRSIILYEQSLTIYKEFNNKRSMAIFLNIIGDVYRQKGELDRALECIEQAMAINRELKRLRDLANNHDYLIQILIERGDLERARQYFHDWEHLNNQLKDKELHLYYLLNKALILKKSSRTRNKAEAEEILKQILEDEVSDFELSLNYQYLFFRQQELRSVD